MKEIIYPKPIKKGAKIAIISPAGYVEEPQLDKTLELIKSKGYEPVLGKHVYGKFENGYPYSGTEKERISDLNWALNDDEISAIWASRGGYGCQHLLKHLKLNKFRKVFITHSVNYFSLISIKKFIFPSIFTPISPLLAFD